MSCRRGLGAIQLGPLALAQFEGQLSPSFLPPPMVYAGPDPNPQPLPNNLYATQAFAQQVANLLGGQAVSAPPNYNFGSFALASGGSPTTVLPDAWQVSVDGQLIPPGQFYLPGVAYRFDDECAGENFLMKSLQALGIPGGQLSPTCASGSTGLTPGQMAADNSAGTLPAPVSVLPPAPAPITPAPVTKAAGSSAPAASQVAASLPGSNVGGSKAGGSAPVAPQSNGSQLVQTSPASSDIVIGGFDLSTIPWYVWAGAGAVLLFAMKGKR